MLHRLFSSGLLLSLALGCSDGGGGPTAPGSPADSTGPASSELLEPLASAPGLGADSFACSELDEVFVRFSSPGYVRGSDVGLFVNYTGIPPREELRLEIWWDLLDAPDELERVVVDEASVDRIGGRLVYENVLEHSYPETTGRTTRKVRVALILVGKTGACSRNRDVVLTRVGAEDEERNRAGLPCGGEACRVFVTSSRYTGDLGGLAGADEICQDLAEAASLPGTYMAWLSDDNESPQTRFSKAATPYVLVDGSTIASSWQDLTDGILMRHIDITEHDTPPGGAGTVWTRTRTDGSAADFNLGPDCEGWTTDAAGTFGTNGQNQGRIELWSFLGASSCNARLPLYCFQQ